MKASTPGKSALRLPLRELQPSLQVAGLEGKGEEAAEVGSGQTLPLVFGQRRLGPLPNNPTSLWNLSSTNLESAEQLVTLEQLDEAEEGVGLPTAGNAAGSAVVAQLREQASTADKALRIKALQVEEYERELELAYARLEDLERKNGQLRLSFEQRLTQFESSLHLRRAAPREDPAPGRLKALAEQLRVAGGEARATVEEFTLLQTSCHEQLETLRLAVQRNSLGAAERHGATAQLAASRDAETEARKQLTEVLERERELLRVRDRLLARSRLAEARWTEKLREAEGSAALEQERTQLMADALRLAEEEKRRVDESLRVALARVEAVTAAKKRLWKRQYRLAKGLVQGRKRARGLWAQLAARRPAPEAPPRISPRRARVLPEIPHVCLSGRGLCARRRRIEALKRSWGL